ELENYRRYSRTTKPPETLWLLFSSWDIYGISYTLTHTLLSPLQVEPVRVVYPTPVHAAGSPGEPVLSGQQPVVPCGRIHAARLGDHAPRPLHPLRQCGLARGCARACGRE